MKAAPPMTTDDYPDYPYYTAPVPQPTADFALGACRDYPTEMFFPRRGDWQSMIAAKKICATCSITEACLQFALESNEIYGVWGGMSGRERRQEASRRRRIPVEVSQPH